MWQRDRRFYSTTLCVRKRYVVCAVDKYIYFVFIETQCITCNVSSVFEAFSMDMWLTLFHILIQFLLNIFAWRSCVILDVVFRKPREHGERIIEWFWHRTRACVVSLAKARCGKGHMSTNCRTRGVLNAIVRYSERSHFDNRSNVLTFYASKYETLYTVSKTKSLGATASSNKCLLDRDMTCYNIAVFFRYRYTVLL